MGKLVLMNFIHIYIVSHLGDTMVGKGMLGQSETVIQLAEWQADGR